MNRKLVKGLFACAIGVAGLVLLTQSNANAAISGRCDNCHTMHNSQDGTNMTTGTTNAQDYLLISTCLGCHTGTDGSSAINASTTAPAVMHTSDPTGGGTYLAGGSFYYETTGDEYVHNVQEIGNPDGTHGDTPPGNNSVALANSLGCISGSTTGCHTGGGHHANVGGDYGSPNDIAYVDGSDVGNSYRFLSGVIGGEDGDWEYTTANDEHNVYFASSTYNNTDTDTITSVCEACHGDFHGSATGGGADGGTGGPSSPWIRHPTDIDLYGVASEHLSYGTYSVLAPIASESLNAQGYTSGQTFTTAVGTTFDDLNDTNLDIVTCVSCHRAHGSPYLDLLRWSYNQMQAGGGNTFGCFKCHSDKN